MSMSFEQGASRLLTGFLIQGRVETTTVVESLKRFVWRIQLGRLLTIVPFQGSIIGRLISLAGRTCLSKIRLPPGFL